MAVESRCSAAEQECCSSSNPNHSTVESLYIAGHHRHVAELGFEWLFAIVQHRVGVDDGDGDGGMSATFEWVGASVVVRKVADDLFAEHFVEGDHHLPWCHFGCLFLAGALVFSGFGRGNIHLLISLVQG